MHTAGCDNKQYTMHITSAKEVMSYPAFVCLFVSLSVCLFTTSRKNTDRIFMKKLPAMFL